MAYQPLKSNHKKDKTMIAKRPRTCFTAITVLLLSASVAFSQKLIGLLGGSCSYRGFRLICDRSGYIYEGRYDEAEEMVDVALNFDCEVDQLGWDTSQLSHLKHCSCQVTNITDRFTGQARPHENCICTVCSEGNYDVAIYCPPDDSFTYLVGGCTSMDCFHQCNGYDDVKWNSTTNTFATPPDVVPLTADEICHGFMALDSFVYCECYDDNESDGLLRVRVKCRRNKGQQCNTTEMMLQQAQQTDPFYEYYPFSCHNVMFETLVAPYIIPPEGAMVNERAVSCTTTYSFPDDYWQACVVMEATELALYDEIRQVRAKTFCFAEYIS